MKRIISALAALVIALSGFTFTASAETVTGQELVAGKGKITVDGKIGSGEWSNAATVTINNSNTTVTVVKEGEVPSEENEIKLSIKYDNDFLYILEERATDYLYNAYSETYKHQVYRGDSTDVFLSLYLPGANEQEQLYVTSDIMIAADSTDGDASKNESAPLLLFRENSFYGVAWDNPRKDDAVNWKIKSVVSEDRKSSVTEVAVPWKELFQGMSMHDSDFVDYKKYIKEFVAAEGLALKFAAIVHEGNANRDHCYSLAYGAEIKVEPDSAYNGTNLTGSDILQWNTVYLGKKSDGQIDLAAVVESAKDDNAKAAKKDAVIKVVVIVVIVLAVIAIAVFIVFRIFGIQIGIGSSDDEDDDEDEDDEEEEEEE